MTKGSQHITANIGTSGSQPSIMKATDPVPLPAHAKPVPASQAEGNWAVTGPATLSSGQEKSIGSTVTAVVPTDSTEMSALTNNSVRLNLQKGNARLPLDVTALGQLSSLQLVLSNDHWSKTVTMNVLNALATPRQMGGRASLSGQARNRGAGGWQASAPGFDSVPG